MSTDDERQMTNALLSMGFHRDDVKWAVRVEAAESEAERLRGVVQAVEVLRELSEKATPGPWGWRPFGGDPANFCRIVVYLPAVETWAVIAEDMEPGDADFIVAAVDFVRAALAAAADAPQPEPERPARPQLLPGAKRERGTVALDGSAGPSPAVLPGCACGRTDEHGPHDD